MNDTLTTLTEEEIWEVVILLSLSQGKELILSPKQKEILKRITGIDE